MKCKIVAPKNNIETFIYGCNNGYIEPRTAYLKNKGGKKI
jgi:hypothetical protein